MDILFNSGDIEGVVPSFYSMIIYLILSIILILISVVLFIPALRARLQPYEQGLNFILTLTATLIGVFIGISLSNYEEQKTENENVVKVLDFAASLIQNTLDYTQGIEGVILEAADSTAATLVEKNPIPFPDQYQTVLENDFILRNISKASMGRIFNAVVDAQKIHVVVNTADDAQRIRQYIEIYKLLLWQLKELTLLEVEHQKGNLELGQLNVQIDQVLDKYAKALEDKSSIDVLTD